MSTARIKSVAIIGAGASGAVTASAFDSEGVFDIIRVFERRETPGGTWIYDPDPGPSSAILPGKLPPDTDPSLKIPSDLPKELAPNTQYRYEKTPIYSGLTTNVPEIAMSFSDRRFPYGPFTPHWVPRQYIENYFTWYRTDKHLVLNTTVEDVSRIPAKDKNYHDGWRLTLRRFDGTKNVDVWWREDFDAVIFANGHYSVPFIPQVKGLEEYFQTYPDVITHSRRYRSPEFYTGKNVVVIGNSASGRDVTTELVKSGKVNFPVYQSRRTPSRWEGDEPPESIEWKPIITEYDATTKTIHFEDGSSLTDIDSVIYCTGYKPSYPFWNSEANGGPLFDYAENHLLGFYQHTFSYKFPHTLGIIGLPRVLTFRSFEYQAVALARLFSGRNARSLPPLSEQQQWERERAERTKRERLKFHDIQWDTGETMDWLRFLFNLSGLPELEGFGRCPPVLGPEIRWAIEHVRKYPEPEKGKSQSKEAEDGEWVLVIKNEATNDSLHFI